MEQETGIIFKLTQSNLTKHKNLKYTDETLTVNVTLCVVSLTGVGEKQNLKSPQKYDSAEPSNLPTGSNPQFRLDVDPKQNLIQAQILKQQQIIYQQQLNGNFNESLPPPPQHMLRPDSHKNNYEIYAESNQMNNGNRNSKLMVQQVRLSQSERPGLPPPPIPDNGLSDLQQIQQQMMRKFDQVISHNHDPNELNSEFSSDLPPPPSPPNFTESSNFSLSLNQRITNLTISQKKLDTPDSVIDMPLPPPPIELQDTIELPPPISPLSSHKNNHQPLPPPPPLPPLVESDTTSSTSSLSAANTSTTGNTPKPPIDKPSTTPSFLDDINKKRFVLKPTKIDEDKKNGRNDSSREAIQCLVNNSDVAAIIDFVRKFRPHVRDSSDDEENSDWDE
ncbi:hypothetical protein BpHYR1_022956 [Brachionus plicatilis]|uniref:Uncharacterized protein n=1 Tax=Brachionus plicatilis TaxID=10195 RepID=A0A3M7PVD3_BRAPC|nr:hypothetical protein BpHYR1_022956 [Brachionus plicatilis]